MSLVVPRRKGSMPPRNKPSKEDARTAIAGSLKEWGVNPARPGVHATFSKKITSIAEAIIEPTREIDLLSEIEIGNQVKLPKDRDGAIKMVYLIDLLEYKDDEIYELRLEEVEDALEGVLTARDKANGIVGIPPYYTYAYQAEGRRCLLVKRKQAFLRFKDYDLDPFERFSLTRDNLSKAELAFSCCFDEGWMNGYAFEAIVSSHAIHNEACYLCRRRNSLVWFGGSEYSWRDLYCRSCHSCFEIKSKSNKDTIERIFRYELHGGSFARWCSEGFKDRKEGSDFIVLVSRKPSYVRRNEWAWSVEIGEVNSALPTVSLNSIASKCQDNHGYLRTVLTLKNRTTWFNIPMQEMPDLKSLFRQSFDEVFPGEWDQVANEINGVAASEEGTSSMVDVPSLSLPPPPSIDEIRSALEDLAVDDWEDYDSS